MPTVSPSEGERRAVRGFTRQYLVAAEVTYDSLNAGTLEFVRMADPSAGRLDDFQIGTIGGLDAYQIKWSEYPTTRTFSSILKVDDAPSIIQQLADGWSRLKTKHSNRAVRVHFLTNDIASAHDVVDRGITSPRHFSAFLRHGWPTGEAWVSTRERLRNETGFDRPTFDSFARSCSFEFGKRLEEPNASSPMLSRSRMEDVTRIASLFFRLVGSDRRIVELSHVELLAELGWETRFRSRFRHEFPIDERRYRPILKTADLLDRVLQMHSSGYVGVIGSPGSGKSTLLTHSLKYRKNTRVVRYYAFVRDDTNLARGEAANFLHDLCVALAQFSQEHPRHQDGEPELAALLTRQLATLSEQWVQDQTKTIVLVDGLDHIEREQNPIRSLLKALPLPENLPPGILFVLGSQRLDLEQMPVRIRTHIAGDRLIEMSPLSREAVFEITEATYPRGLTTEQKGRILEKSDGHPLALNYILQRISTGAGVADIEDILLNAPAYTGTIEEDYLVYWNSIADDESLRELLALLARIRTPIDLDLVQKWTTRNALEKLIRQTSHYFRHVSPTRWQFFHNSFRQFVIVETAKDPLARIDKGINSTTWRHSVIASA